MWPCATAHLMNEFFSPQIQDVELVDPGRDDQQRPALHLLGRRRVLDELHQVVLEDDLAGRDRDVLADLEGVQIGHLDAQLALAALEVAQQVLQALHQVLAAGLDGRPQHFRIGEQEIGRRHRVDELAGVEIDLLRRLVVEAVHLPHRLLHPARGQQVGLLDVVEELVLFPGRILEAAVVRRRAVTGAASSPIMRRAADLPEVHMGLPQVHLRLPQLGRIGHQPRGHLHERSADIERIGHAEAMLALMLQEIADDALRPLGDAGKGLGQLGRVGKIACRSRLIRHLPFPMIPHGFWA